MKRNIIKSLAATVIFAVSAPVFSSAFDITYVAYQSGISSRGNGAGSAYVFTNNGDSEFHIDGYSVYVDELIEYYELLEHRSLVEYVNSTYNTSLTDNKAYAAVYRLQIDVDTDLDGQADEHYWHSDIISGSDWDNNGLIDVLENTSVLRHRNVGEVKPR
ncbi:hypothetical protein [Arsukibacterium indicum]|uniref:Uncharacterized protein n=1 Tax=Arsukibacterium indicum TaxID=2848612 RepID=A0ABS6MLH0_9GAMM|nr:hypothetical protein [Arsukibacterium indicum]MBV2129666.1 hypothetical protein [Arsukibacterium indicum]